VSAEREAAACPCGRPHPAAASYYVAVRDGGRTGLLAGPFLSHAAAIGRVTAVRMLAEQIDFWAHFYEFGTVVMPASYTAPGRLNHLLAGEH
jgi:hypothetical protein